MGETALNTGKALKLTWIFPCTYLEESPFAFLKNNKQHKVETKMRRRQAAARHPTLFACSKHRQCAWSDYGVRLQSLDRTEQGVYLHRPPTTEHVPTTLLNLMATSKHLSKHVYLHV